MRKTFVVYLVGGIGNILQTVPFMSWLKSQGHEVLALRDRQAYCDEICEMVAPAYTSLVRDVPNSETFINKGNMMTSAEGKKLVARMPEWKAWFVYHGFEVPSSVDMAVRVERAKSPSRVVLAPCCKPNWPMKRWPHWQGLIDRMPGCAVVGLPTDGSFGGDFIDLRGKTNLKELSGILADADYVIAEEGGIAHLACAVGTTTYILYGGTDPVKNSPPCKSIQVMSSQPFGCRPCQGRGWYYENTPTEMVVYGCRREQMVKEHARCMHALTPYEVLKAVADNGDWWVV